MELSKFFLLIDGRINSCPMKKFLIFTALGVMVYASMLLLCIMLGSGFAVIDGVEVSPFHIVFDVGWLILLWPAIAVQEIVGFSDLGEWIVLGINSFLWGGIIGLVVRCSIAVVRTKTK